MKDHCIFYIVGIMLLAPGWLLLKLSPQYTQSAEFKEQARAAARARPIPGQEGATPSPVLIERVGPIEHEDTP